METKEITLPEGWVIDKQEGNKLILKEELTLDIWKNCFIKLNDYSDGTYKLSYINDLSIIQPRHVNDGYAIGTAFHNTIPKEYAEPILALMQLLVCYKAWVNNYTPDWTCPYHDKYCICVGENKLDVVKSDFISRLFTFPTEKKCRNFLTTFRDLLEQARPLL